MALIALTLIEWWDVDVIGYRFATVRRPTYFPDPYVLRNTEVLIEKRRYTVVNATPGSGNTFDLMLSEPENVR